MTMARRPQLVPWRTAGRVSEEKHSGDDVVRETGWVFNNRTGEQLTLREFTESGDNEVGAYLHLFGLDVEGNESRTLVEIGAGIGRMTAAFTRIYGHVVACDLDAAFLERCRQTVSQFGRVGRLQTCHVDDGRTLAMRDDSADVTFSYITLQHCRDDDALSLVSEAIRVTRPGGCVALNFRTWSRADIVLWPFGNLVRMLWRLPAVGDRIARQRLASRFGWQANRLSPYEVLRHIGAGATPLAGVRLVRSPHRRAFSIDGVEESTFEGVNRSHWWLVARVPSAA